MEISLLDEMVLNLIIISQIRTSYEKNLTEENELALPTRTPRNTVITEFIKYKEFLDLARTDRDSILNIHEQLSTLKKEYYIWRNMLYQHPYMKYDKTAYVAFSLPMKQVNDVLLHNLFDMWVQKMLKDGYDSKYEPVANVSKMIELLLSSKKVIGSTYSISDEYLENNNFDVIICWSNDSKSNNNIDVIELKNILKID